ncbi:hypothetical protein [Paenibacillus doosanensis]|uniref:hypothetical protein n=1 Tax=Paenibacillus doosanensis TaxID=1229154 RepID=UPI00218046D3|nr:hypothetical protein [Paenibacillus doosanensis]
MQLNFNTEQLKKRLKENIERNIVSGHQVNDAYFSNIEKLIELHNISEVHYFSHRKFLGKFIIAFKKVIRKLIRPILNKQITFNQLMIENVRYLQQQVKDNQEHQAKKIEELLISSVDDLVNDLKDQENARNHYLTEVAASSNNNLETNLNKFKDEINYGSDKKISELQKRIELQTEIVEQLTLQIQQQKNEIEQQKIDIESLNNKILNIVDDSRKETTKNILIELSDFYFRKNEFDLSYQLLLFALKYDPDNIELEGKLLSVFDTLNKSRNLQ